MFGPDFDLEFNSEVALQEVYNQNLNLAESSRRRARDGNYYKQGIGQFHVSVRKIIQIRKTRNNLLQIRANLLKMKRAFDELQKESWDTLYEQDVATVKIQQIDDADTYISKVNGTVKRIENLGSEFDESMMSQQTTKCIMEKQNLKRSNGEKHLLSKGFRLMTIQDFVQIANLTKWNRTLSSLESFSKIKLNVTRKGNKFELNSKNVEYLDNEIQNLKEDHTSLIISSTRI